MGVSVRVAGASFANNLASLSLADRADLAGEYVFGGDFDTSKINLANPDLPLTLQGVPTYGANYARVLSGPGGYGFITGLTPSLTSTQILIRKRTSGHSEQGVVAGAYSGLWGFYDRSNADSKFHDGDSNLGGGASSALPVVGTVFFEAGVLAGGSGTTTKKYSYPAGTQVESVDATPAPVGSPLPVFVGTTNLYSTVATPYDIYYYALYQRVLTAAEIDDAYQSLKAFMLKTRGVSI